MKKILKYGLGIPILSTLIIIAFVGSGYFYTVDQKADCAVIFGAAVWREDIPSDVLYDRIRGGIELYKSNKVACLVLSGGPSKYGAHEVAVMKKLFQEVDIPVTDMHFDYEGTNTQETISNLPVGPTYIFVSNDFHLARIRLFAWRFGHKNPQFYPVKHTYGRYIKEPYFFAREVLGIGWYFKGEILGIWGFCFLCRWLFLLIRKKYQRQSY